MMYRRLKCKACGTPFIVEDALPHENCPDCKNTFEADVDDQLTFKPPTEGRFDKPTSWSPRRDREDRRNAGAT